MTIQSDTRKFALALAFIGLCACSEGNSGAAEPQASAPAADSAQQGSAIMNEPMDGSSIESFEAALAVVKASATDKEFKSLKSALDYRLFYDLQLNHDKAALYKSVDGQTPTQIIENSRRKK